jgi:ubiquinone/menaquinone biosynthesis C-methylase UbiE
MTLPGYAVSQSSLPEAYERWLVGPLFRPFAEEILDGLALSPGNRLLDIACGTGIVSRVARERLGHAACIVGVDLSPDMLAVARGVAPDIDWREGNAGALPLRDGETCDVAVCHQGLQFFPDRSRAAAEMRRALAGGGRLAVATWRSDEESPFIRELRQVAERRLGAVSDQRYGFGDAGPIEALLLEAGFHDARSRTISRTIRFEDGAAFVELNAMALVGMSAAGKLADARERRRLVDAIVDDSAAVVKAHHDGSELAFELATNLSTARA